MKKVIAGLFALVFMTIASVVYAADANIEFGVTDDLTVEGAEGTLDDADVEIDGFMVIGDTHTRSTSLSGPGNLWVQDGIDVGSISAVGYGVFGGSVTAGGLDVSGWANFTSTVTILEGQLIIGGGSPGQVLKKSAGGTFWGTIAGGALESGNIGYIPYWDAANHLMSTFLLRDADDSYTFEASSLTVEGEITVMNLLSADGGIDVNGANFTVTTAGAIDTVSTLDVDGTASLDGGIDVNSLFVVNAAGDLTIGSSDEFTVAAANGNTAIAGTLGVDGLTVLNSSATVLGNLGVGQAYAADTALSINATPSTEYAAKFYQDGTLAAWIKAK